MKRRNAEGGKLRRPIKRTKITESIYGSTLLYLKFLMLWALVLLADFVLEFRFEFLWPFWLLLRSVYDSFKYQGLAFSAFFVCVAATSDMICFFFIPVHWLFFLASTYVWVQYVWHTEKGICLPTVILCMLFVYVEAAVRLRGDFRHPFHVDLCRPFAAHCIGYPVVTFGFGFKSYVGYRMRQRRQKEVAKENEFYMQLLQQALPAQQEVQTPVANSTSPEKNKGTPNPIAEHDNGKMSNGSVANGITVSPNGSVKNNHRKSLDKGPEKDQQDKKISHNHANGSIHTDVEYIERISSVNDFDANEIEKDKVTKGCNNRSQEKGGNKWNSSKQAQENVVNSQREKRSKNNKESHTETNNFTNKDEYLQRLEADVKRLKIDLQSSRQIEQDLRSQLVSVTNCERSAKSELTQLQHHNDDLQTRLHGLVNARQLDKQAMSQLEKKLADERRARGSCEAQLAAERKAKKAEEAAAAQAVAIATALNKGECTESCRARRRELEAETKQLKRELKLKEERILSSEREIQNLRQYRDTHSETEILMSALSAMQDKTTHLENSLSAETKIKLDLFSALGEAKRQLEIRENLIRAQEKELEELKAKLAQVLAVMPTEPFCSSPPPTSGTSKFRLSESHLRCFTNDDSFGSMASLRSLTESPVSTLDPNATAYTPKGTLCAKYFAEELHRSLPLMFPAPDIIGLLELEWHETVTDWRRLYGAEFWNLGRPVAVFLDGRFIGSDTDLFKMTCHSDIFVVSIPMKSSSLMKQKFTSDYLSYLKNTKLIYCYFDMCVDETFIGTLVFQLYSNILPKTCENFITLCLGSKGSSLSYKGSRIHRIVEHGWLQGGDVQNCAEGGRSNTFRSTLEDECFGISHDRRGVLSMVKNGRYTSTSQFLITLGPHPWMDTRYVAFGQVIEGVQVLDRMENIETIRESPLKKIEIKNCGKFDIQDVNEIDIRYYPDMREPVPKKRYRKLETVSEEMAKLIMEALTDCLSRKEHKLDVIHIDDAPSRTRLDFFFQGYYSLSEEAVNETAKYLRTFRREMLRYMKPTATEIVEVIAYDLQEAVFAKLVHLDDVREATGHPLFNELLEKMDKELEICEKPYIEKFVNQLVATAENMLKLISKKLNWIRRSSRKNRVFQEQMDEWITSFVLQETFSEDRYHIVDRSPGDMDDVASDPCQENVVKKKEKEPINAETCCNKDRERDYFNIGMFFSTCRYELRKPKRDTEERVTTMELIECGRNYLRTLRPEENQQKSKTRICLEKKISQWMEGVTYVYDTQWIRQTIFAKEDVCFSHTEEIMYGAMTVGLLEIYYLMEEYLKKPKKKVYRTRVIYPEGYTTSEESFGKSAEETESKLEPEAEKVADESEKLEPCPCGDVCCDCSFKPVIKDEIIPPTPPPSLVTSAEEEEGEVDVSKGEASTSSCTPTSAIDVEELMAQIVGESTENVNVKSFKWMEDYIRRKGCQLKSDFAQQVHKWLENDTFNNKFISKHSLVTRASLLSFSLSLASLMKEENELKTELKDFVYDLWELYFLEMLKELELQYPPQDEASEEVYKTVAEDDVAPEKAKDACEYLEEKIGVDFDFDLFCREFAGEGAVDESAMNPEIKEVKEGLENDSTEAADEIPNTEKKEAEEGHETEKSAAAAGADMEIPGEDDVEDQINRTADVETKKDESDQKETEKTKLEPKTIRELVVSVEEVRETSPYALPFWIKFLAEVTKMALGTISKVSRGPRRLYFTTDSQITVEDRMKAWIEFNKFHSPTTDRRDLQDFIAKHHVDVDDLDATARSFLKKKVIVEMMESTTRKKSAEIVAEELILELLAKTLERLDVEEGKYKVSATFMKDLIGMTGEESYPEPNEDENDGEGREFLGEE